MPLLPSRVKSKPRVWTPSVPGPSFESDLLWAEAHVALGKPVDGAFVLWLIKVARGFVAAELEELREKIEDLESERDDLNGEIEDLRREVKELEDRDAE